MTALAQRPVKSGAVIVKEYGNDVGFNRQAATALIDATTQVGRVFKTDGDGTYSSVVAADVAGIAGTELVILIDDYLYDVLAAETGIPKDMTVAVLEANTGVMIGDANLSFGDTLSAPQKVSVVDELKAQGFRVVSQAPQV